MITELWLDSLQLMGTGASLNYWVNGFTGLGTPQPRVERPDRSRRHGAIEMTTYYGPRTFSFDIWILGDDNSDWANFWTAHDDLNEAMALGSGSQVLSFKRSGLDYLESAYVRSNQEATPEWPHAGTPVCVLKGVEMTAADPRLYATDLQTVNITGTDDAVNGGNFNTPPLIRFNGPGTNPGASNDTLSTENEININYTLSGGDIVEVDCMARTVKLNGTSRPDILDSATSSFWRMARGINTITNIGGLAASIDVEWNDARI